MTSDLDHEAEARPAFAMGWMVLFGVFVVMTIGSGFAFYAQGVFLSAFVEERGFSVGFAGAGTGFFFVVSGIAGYYCGALIGRFDVRIVMTLGTVVAAGGIALMGYVRDEWQMFPVFMIFGGGYALAGLVPTSSIVTRWFHRRRSVALSVASTGLSLGGIAITPVLATIIDRDTLASTSKSIAVVYLAAVLVAVWGFVRPEPERYGLRPDGDVAPPGDGGPQALPGVDFEQAMASRYFRYMAVAFILIMGAQVGGIQHLFNLTKGRVDIDAAKLALVVITLTSVCARLVGGVLATRVSLTRLTSALIVVQAVGLVLIGFAESTASILGGAIVLGSAMGNLLMLHPLLLADAFGVKDYPRIYGMGSLLMVVGVGLGPFAVGLLRDLFDYRIALVVMAGVALVGASIFRAAGAPGVTEEELRAANATSGPRPTAFDVRYA